MGSDRVTDGEGSDEESQPPAAVVSLGCKPSVGFDTDAHDYVEALTEVALELAALTRRQGVSPAKKREYITTLDNIIRRMEVVDEHVGILTEHAQTLLSLMDHSELALFENETRLATYRVMSLVQKRAQTLHIHRLAFSQRGVIPQTAQDNQSQVDQFHNARLARGSVVKAVR